MTSTNLLYTAMDKNYSEIELLNIISHAEEYSKAQVIACKEEIKRRQINVENTKVIAEGQLVSYVLYSKGYMTKKIKQTNA